MTPDLKQRLDQRLQRIANVLLLNASFINNLGMLNGKMGIAIFFYHYARYTGNKVYEDFAGELIDEIYEEIKLHTPLNFANGLTGIGWGIEYLVKNGFVEAETDEALSEIDSAVFHGTTQMPVYIEKDDLFGFGLYFLTRLHGREHDNNNNKVLFLKQMSVYMVDECERLLVHKKFLDANIPNLSAGQLNSIMHFLQEVHRLELFPVKVKKLFRYIPSYIEIIVLKNDDWADLQTLWHLTHALLTIISETDVRDQYQVVVDLLAKQLTTTRDDENIVDHFTKLSWHSLVYPVNYFNHEDVKLLAEKAFDAIDNEENWNQRIDKLNKDNMGLNNGLAGLGLGLLNEGMKELRNEKNEKILETNRL